MKVEGKQYLSHVRIAGCGGAGCNAINNIIDSFKEDDLQHIFIGFDTNASTLIHCKAPNKIQLGTKGHGAGSDPLVGEKLAREQREDIKESLREIELLFIICGLGGGTGTGATPVIAEIAKELGILVIVLATLPFAYQGIKKQSIMACLHTIKQSADFVNIVSNQTLLSFEGTITELFYKVDEWYATIVNCIFAIIYKVGRNSINIRSIISSDFSDLRTIIKDSGFGVITSGYSNNRAIDAVQNCFKSHLFCREVSLETAKSIMVHIVTSMEISMREIVEVFELLGSIFTQNVTIIHSISIMERPGSLVWSELKDQNGIVVFLIVAGAELEDNSLPVNWF